MTSKAHAVTLINVRVNNYRANIRASNFPWRVCDTRRLYMHVNDTCMWMTRACEWHVHVNDTCMWMTRACEWHVHVNDTCMWTTRTCEWDMHVNDTCMWINSLCCRNVLNTRLNYFVINICSKCCILLIDALYL